MREINIRELKENPLKMISDDWALLSAGNEESFNTMTVSWGGIGELWGKDVAFVFVRPQRYTKEFIDREGMMTLSFFCGEYKKELGFCGKNSGRDFDKMNETGLHPEFSDGTVYIKEAKNVLILKTLAVTEMTPDSFLDKTIDSDCYPNKDYHIVYIAEIVKTLEK